VHRGFRARTRLPTKSRRVGLRPTQTVCEWDDFCAVEESVGMLPPLGYLSRCLTSLPE
jgi:hypothetical protein